MKNKNNNDTIEAVENDFSNLPNIYANTFSIGLNSSDIGLILATNGIKKLTVNIPFSIAKTLAHALNEHLENYEKITNQQILSATDISELFETARES